LAKALSWARQVQLLGYAENMGPLWLEADIGSGVVIEDPQALSQADV
jgi:hypothetical protein